MGDPLGPFHEVLFALGAYADQVVTLVVMELCCGVSESGAPRPAVAAARGRGAGVQRQRLAVFHTTCVGLVVGNGRRRRDHCVPMLGLGLRAGPGGCSGGWD